jgi:hypothetical protein
LERVPAFQNHVPESDPRVEFSNSKDVFDVYNWLVSYVALHNEKV